MAIEEEYGIKITKTPLWITIQSMGFRQKVPRPTHAKADKEKQDAFKKNCCANQPISADQIINALGVDKIHAIADKLGVADNQVSDGLASVLPQIIDKLAPNGKVPEGDVLKQGISLLSKQFLNS